MALEAKNINNATDMRNYVEGCLNDLVEGLSTVEETMAYMKEYTHRVIDLASESQKLDTSDEALPIADVGGSLPLVEIDKDVLKTCVEMYKTGDKITAVKWLMEEAKKPTYTFGVRWAKEYLEKQ